MSRGQFAGYFLLGAVTVTAYVVSGVAGWAIWQTYQCAKRHQITADDLLLGGG